MHESSEEFEIRRDSTIDCGFCCPLASEKNRHRRIMGEKRFLTFSRLLLIGFFSYLQVTHKSSKEFEIRPDPTTDCRVSCPLTMGKFPIDL